MANNWLTHSLTHAHIYTHKLSRTRTQTPSEYRAIRRYLRNRNKQKQKGWGLDGASHPHKIGRALDPKRQVPTREKTSRTAAGRPGRGRPPGGSTVADAAALRSVPLRRRGRTCALVPVERLLELSLQPPSRRSAGGTHRTQTYVELSQPS